MRVPFFNMISEGRLAWLLGLLLLMPLAQTAANWHLIAHTHAQAARQAEQQSAQRSDDISAGFEDCCELCQIAIATSAGLLPTQPVVMPAVVAPVDLPLLALLAARGDSAWLLYASRAPPTLL